MLKADKNLSRQLAHQAQCLSVVQGGVAPARVRVQETQDGYLMEVFVPSLQYEQYAVEIQQGQLLVFTYNAMTCTEEGMVFPMFMGVYPILPHVDAQRIEAIFDNGVLRIFAPFREGIRHVNKKIKIKRVG